MKDISKFSSKYHSHQFGGNLFLKVKENKYNTYVLIIVYYISSYQHDRTVIRFQ